MPLCPACQSELDPAADSCPICLRPRSRQEMMRSFAELKKEELRRKRIPYFIAAGIALIGLGFWRGQEAYRIAAPVVASKVAGIVKRAQDALDRAESPEYYAPGGSKGSSVASKVVVFQMPARHQAVPAPAPAAKQPEAPHWELSGQVYDLLSLKPASGASLAFTAPDGTVARAKADAAGRYQVALPILSEGGYALAVKLGKTRADYLEEGYVPFQQLDLARRKEQARDAAKAKVLHVPITVDESDQLLYNVALLPARRK